MTCSIYLLRHAKAVERSPGMDDADRPLTALGRRRFEGVVRGLKRLGVAPDCILSSPLVRARETADLLASGLGPRLSVQLEPRLAPGYAPKDVLQILSRHRTARQLVIVGHEPGIGQLASTLITGSPTLANLPFKKGAVAALRGSLLAGRGRTELLWFLTPRQLRLVARRNRTNA